MKILATDTFFKSLRKLSRDNMWYMRLYHLVRYDIPSFFSNLYSFRMELWHFKHWDSSYNLSLLKRSLELTCDNLERYGHEVDESRLKKIAKIKRTIELLNNHAEDNFIEQAEKEIGKEVVSGWDFVTDEKHPGLSRMVDKATPEEQAVNAKIFDRARQMEDEQWKELFSILQGQEPMPPSPPGQSFDDNRKAWEDYYDGSGMKGWWD